MKKIINGKMYDTEKANQIGYHDNGLSYSDFSYVCETLYKKRTGEYFLHGDGGAMSKYAVHSGDNSWGGGEKIIPMEYESARKWAEGNLTADEYQAEFGEVTEGDADTIVCKLAAADGAKLRRMAQERGISITAMVTDLIRNA